MIYRSKYTHFDQFIEPHSLVSGATLAERITDERERNKIIGAFLIPALVVLPIYLILELLLTKSFTYLLLA
jgi:hypothetical protein